MTKCNILTLTIIIILFVLNPHLFGNVSFNDGQVHNVDYEINGHVLVDYQSPGMQTTVNWLNGASTTSNYTIRAYENSNVYHSGALCYFIRALDSSKIVVSGGTISKGMGASENSQIQISAGDIGDYWYDGSAIPAKDFVFPERDYLYVNNESKIVISGGNIGAILKTNDNSHANAYGGMICSFQARDNSQVNISEGVTTFTVSANDNSHVNISGGVIENYLTTGGDSHVDISGGTIGNYLFSSENSRINISGGSINSLLASINSKVCIFDGSIITNLYASENSRVDIWGGSIGGNVSTAKDSILTIYGRDFAVDYVPVGYIELNSIFGGSIVDEPFRRLTGVLANGELMSNRFRIGANAKIVLIPEPSTILLIGLGALAMLKKRKV